MVAHGEMGGKIGWQALWGVSVHRNQKLSFDALEGLNLTLPL
jgi:hypothetical protein